MARPSTVIRCGPAGWAYRDWNGVVYPKPKPRGFDPLLYLAAYFDVIEVNSTYYRPATPKTARDWVRRVERNDRFRFTAKLWRRFTHERTQAWTAAEVAKARAAFDVLHDAGRLGAVLLQFPWSFRRSDENREWLDDLASAFDAFPLVLEVRHESWNAPEFYAELLARGLGFVNIDQPQFGDSIAPSARATSPVGYVRVHGRNYRDWWRRAATSEARYDYLYTADELKPWVRRIREIAEETQAEEVYVITNNHYRGQAPANALMVQSMLERRKVGAPPPLFEEFGDVLGRYARARELEPA